MRDDAYFFPYLDRVFLDVDTIYDDPSVSRAYKSGQYLYKGGLSCAVGTEYCKEFAMLDFEVDIAQDDVVPEGF